jgi:predicted ester cyclase
MQRYLHVAPGAPAHLPVDAHPVCGLRGHRLAVSGYRVARQATEGVTLGAEANKAVTRRALEEVLFSPSAVPAEEVDAADFVSRQHSHPTVTDIRGIEQLKSFVRESQAAFPDFVDTVERQIAEGDLVMTQFTSAGTPGELMGITPTGKRIEWMGIELARVEGGKIAENWVSWDRYGCSNGSGRSRHAADRIGAERLRPRRVERFGGSGRQGDSSGGWSSSPDHSAWGPMWGVAGGTGPVEEGRPRLTPIVARR